ncbi:TetR/AcrR family transcriptional regulator [Alkalibacter mobilis]|uniref:TetR/AcrR family transcriptional regulator n=1 Tax=Alkalibacter mobilis TaxID=2787712 RepID=UPI00189CD19C|nr:TetR/AcrR family transcriptional regulator [Alkalibacter mobilis]MBF7096839.1 TetR/AcrR family transcriptional regulator [Alkalibacter mobilis]
MTRYKKGLETKLNLVAASKKLFYEKGINQTKIVEICRMAQTSPKNFHYYFDSKLDVAGIIQGDFLVATYVYIDNNEKNLNCVQRNIRSAMMHYSIIFNDENNTKYFHEVLKNRTISDYMGNNVRRIYSQINKEFKLGFSDKDLQFISSADMGVRRELALKYIEGGFPTNIIEFVSYLYSFTGKLFELDKSLIQNYTDEAIQFIENNNFKHVKLLV